MENHQKILNEITQASPLIASIPRANVYHLPGPDKKENDTSGDYFDNLAETILLRIRQEEVRNVTDEINLLAPVLNDIDKKAPYHLPEGYFDNFTVENTTSPTQETKVFSINKYRKLWIPAAAAIIGIIIAGSVWLLLNRPSQQAGPDFYQSLTGVNIQQSIADLSDNEILDYLNTNYPSFSDMNLDADQEIQHSLDNINDKDLEKLLQTVEEQDKAR